MTVRKLATAILTLAMAVFGSSQLAQAQVTPPTKLVVVEDLVNVRSAASTTSRIIGRVTKNDVLDGFGMSDDKRWWQVRLNGRDGYISAQFVQLDQDAADVVVAPAVTSVLPHDFGWGIYTDNVYSLKPISNNGFGWVKIQLEYIKDRQGISSLVKRAHELGLKVWVQAVGDRSRAADPEYQKQFAETLGFLAQQGADAIEVWKMPNLALEYGGQDNGQVSPESYANLLRESYLAIKSVYSDTLVVSSAPAPAQSFGGCTSAGCDSDKFYSRMAAAGAGQYLDCVGAAFLGSPIAPDAPDNATLALPFSFAKVLDSAYLPFQGQKKVCWTAFGYPVNDSATDRLPDNLSWAYDIGFADQAKWLASAAHLSANSGKVMMMMIANWDLHDSPVHSYESALYSLSRPNGKCPACAALRAGVKR
jgi:hypothetical protein